MTGQLGKDGKQETSAGSKIEWIEEFFSLSHRLNHEQMFVFCLRSLESIEEWDIKLRLVI